MLPPVGHQHHPPPVQKGWVLPGKHPIREAYAKLEPVVHPPRFRSPGRRAPPPAGGGDEEGGGEKKRGGAAGKAAGSSNGVGGNRLPAAAPPLPKVARSGAPH